MLPPGIEFRPDLTSDSDVLAFGFSGERVDGNRAFAVLSAALIDHISAETSRPPRRVIVDMRNVDFLALATNGKLDSLRKRLAPLTWELVLVLAPGIQDRFDLTSLDRLVTIVTAEELGHSRSSGASLLEFEKGPSKETSIAFTREELAEMTSEGLTLEDAIREIEMLRR